jgi:hypothetical protein
MNIFAWRMPEGKKHLGIPRQRQIDNNIKNHREI